MVSDIQVLRQEEVADKTIARIRERYMNPTDIWGYSWGFDLLDKETGGIQHKDGNGANELTILAARSNAGKSSFGVSVGISVAEQFKEQYPGLQVRIITLEMDADQMLQRLLGQLADVPLRSLNTGRMTPDELRRIEAAHRKLAKLPIAYVQGGNDIGMIEDFIRRKDGKSNQSCGFWILDHVGIVPSGVADRTGNHTFALGQISRQLHEIARQYAPGLVLSQLNRESLKRKDPTPTLTDIYQSDKLVQDADKVLLLHRPEMFEERGDVDEEQDELSFCIVGKNRSGRAGRKLPMAFSPRVALWGDLPVEGELDE
ncbi:DnaB-like helicase C-terminal domain-containing protein [Ktedonobacter robiniae]|uniref:SF4 helicase domain-containing protein n=1 Tax=Ktedonobacter robiniae TaxID=2778365 RepID=A0ABQ3URZ5_9CHLR|nr:DnaB-like helicase C-terminal domain-containing protein [Ktedonobacter robiniae]GHO55494.1 hypothetical protein KSB_39690 [Ktedonobacter robiniae]